jgi:hypothetical protein
VTTFPGLASAVSRLTRRHDALLATVPYNTLGRDARAWLHTGRALLIGCEEASRGIPGNARAGPPPRAVPPAPPQIATAERAWARWGAHAPA